MTGKFNIFLSLGKNTRPYHKIKQLGTKLLRRMGRKQICYFHSREPYKDLGLCLVGYSFYMFVYARPNIHIMLNIALFNYCKDTLYKNYFSNY